ncbi:hypothetical protein [Chengkuizengella axinellae]|uniref:Uncharacterized protein n=1 Tax=Chengkuizengella axinellae TaxID=3064388 RepID=A0ABT9J5H4_9BACL|nr:hypothetical protein [Chengkuizengella sp. 2205SS18-9]MDP5276733.1 hypothetical protein [Chengkuizengella sp. 2205SS18-9]
MKKLVQNTFFYDFSGAVYIGMEGEEVYSKTFGMADYAQEIPITLERV